MALQWVTFISKDEIKAGEREVFDTDYGSILLLNIDDIFYAVENVCSHEEYELSDGQLDACELECSKHGSFFDVRSGEALNPPAIRPIKLFTTRIEGSDVQIMLDIKD